MPTYSTIIKTEHGKKYLQQLCKHFAHKVSVQYSPEEGRVIFPPGRCLMRADDTALQFSFIAEEAGAVPVIQSIIDRHLVKFAWREELDYDWSEGAAGEFVEVLNEESFLPE